MPVLTIRDLTSSELKALQERDEFGDESELGGSLPVDSAGPDLTGTESDESEEIVVEGEEQEEQEESGKPTSTSLEALGGRLVRGGQLP
jgi:hypothetical protein